MKAIIFGAAGQDGYYLTQRLNQDQVDVVSVSRSAGNFIGSVSDHAFVTEIIRTVQPDFIFHLAANSTTRHDVLFENHETISTGSLIILEAVYKYSKQSRVFLSGSGLQFVNAGKPIAESDPFDASSPYAVARIQSTYAARYYRKLGVRAYVGYFFNHDSPLRSERHVNQKIAIAVNQIARGNSVVLEIGDIDVRKEFTFAGDTVDAVWKLVQNDHIFETVIGSGKDYSIKQWIEICFAYRELEWEKHVVQRTEFVAEYRTLVSNPATLSSLGWIQQVQISDLAKMMIEHENAKG